MFESPISYINQIKINPTIPVTIPYKSTGGNVFLIISPSLSTNPTTVAAATTLWIQIIFPAAPPITCIAKIIDEFIPTVCETWYWIDENVNVETVADPVINDPNIPKNGAINTHDCYQ